jgi:large subunit ribosomal protein L10
MDNPRAEKVAVVDQVRRRFDDSSAAILTEYRGLKVKDLAGLRRLLRSNGGDYKIYKNTLVRLAARSSGLAELDEMLLGPTGIAFVDGDAAAVAKVLRDFARTNPFLVIKGGVLGDKVIGAAETSALADLPSREILLARFAGALAAPMQRMAGLLQALPRNFAYGLAALRDQRAEGESGADSSTEAAAPPVEAPAGEVELVEAAPVEDVAAAVEVPPVEDAAAAAVEVSPVEDVAAAVEVPPVEDAAAAVEVSPVEDAVPVVGAGDPSVESAEVESVESVESVDAPEPEAGALVASESDLSAEQPQE